MNTAVKMHITKREHEILKHLCGGLTNKEIARALFISTYTVDTHRKRLLTKLDARNAMHMGVVAERMGLLQSVQV